MNTLKKLNIGTQLSLGFGLITIFVIILATVMLSSIASVGAGVQQMDRVFAQRLAPLYQAREALAQTGLAARNAFIFTDNIQANKELALVDEQKAIYLSALDKLALSYKDEPEFLKVKSGLLLMSEALKRPRGFRESGKMTEYGNFLVNECSPLRRQIVADIAVLVQTTQKQMEEATLASAKRADSARTITLILSGAVLALSILIASLIKRLLLQQLGGEPAYAAAIAERIASGDLAIAVNVKAGDQSSLLYAIKTMRDSLSGIVGKVRCGTDLINGGSSEIVNGNVDLLSRTEQQGTTLEKITVAMEKLTLTVRQNASNANQANILAQSASSISEKGGEAMAQVTETMVSINSSSKKIFDIISVIDGIAFQTNILALNAAVEAARAGEQGRGFAVVATEVRNLAQRSASAAKEIKTLINDSVAKVGSGAELVQKAGTTIQEVVVSVKRVTEIMSEISVASGEQSTGIDQVNGAIGEMDIMRQQNNTLVKEASAAALELRNQASGLAEVVGLFTLDVAANVSLPRPVKLIKQLVIQPSRLRVPALSAA